jgi:hypothetical protein
MSLVPGLDIRRSERLRPEHRAVMDTVLKEEIAKRRWYHRMDLGNGVTTPGHPWEWLWEITRGARNAIDYKNKTVLDLGSWDGMWAFEAEMLGAALAVATDCMNTWQSPWHQGMNNLLLVREAIFSRVVPLFNVSPYFLRERLDNVSFFSSPFEKRVRHRSASWIALSSSRSAIFPRPGSIRSKEWWNALARNSGQPGRFRDDAVQFRSWCILR